MSSHKPALSSVKEPENAGEKFEEIVNINLQMVRFEEADQEELYSDRSRTASNISHLLNFGGQQSAKISNINSRNTS